MNKHGYKEPGAFGWVLPCPVEFVFLEDWGWRRPERRRDSESTESFNENQPSPDALLENHCIVALLPLILMTNLRLDGRQ